VISYYRQTLHSSPTNPLGISLGIFAGIFQAPPIYDPIANGGPGGGHGGREGVEANSRKPSWLTSSNRIRFEGAQVGFEVIKAVAKTPRNIAEILGRFSSIR